jgi:hypothetical protein
MRVIIERGGARFIAQAARLDGCHLDGERFGACNRRHVDPLGNQALTHRRSVDEKSAVA